MEHVPYARGRTTRRAVASAGTVLVFGLMLFGARPAWGQSAHMPSFAAEFTTVVNDPGINGPNASTPNSQQPTTSGSPSVTDPTAAPSPTPSTDRSKEPKKSPPAPTPTTTPDPTPTSSAPHTQPVAAPTSAPPTYQHAGAFAPGRVPEAGSQPSFGASVSATPSGASGDLAADWTSHLPGPEFGIKLFLGGLVALVISIGGLVTVALRQRE